MTELSYVKNLISTATGTEGSLLIVKKIYDTLLEAVDKALIPRSEASLYFGPTQIPGSSIDVDLEEDNTLKVRVVNEGANIPLDEVEYTSTNLKPVKYGVGIRITNEMMEDAKWNLLQYNIMVAGKRFAENETKLILTALDGAANTIAGGSAITVANMNRGIQYLEDSDYEATSMFVGPEVMNDIRNIDTFVEANKAGDNEILRTGAKGLILGMRVYRFSANAAPSTTYSKYAYITDRSHAYMIAEKRAISVEQVMLPQADMRGACITQRITVGLRKSGAVCKITTS